jgi:Domain of unknown function (DUF3127)
MEISGKIKMIGSIQEVSASFKKRELVVTTEEQYPQHIMVEFTQAKVDDLNSYQVGEPVKVSINIRGREWVSPQGETKYFNSIQGWRIERMAAQMPASMPAPPEMPPMPAAPFETATNFNETEPDDLPF